MPLNKQQKDRMTILQNVLSREGGNSQKKGLVDLQSPMLEQMKIRRTKKCYASHNFWTEDDTQKLFRLGPQQGERDRAVNEGVLMNKLPTLRILFNDGFETDDSMKDIDFKELNGLKKGEDSDDDQNHYRRGFNSHKRQKKDKVDKIVEKTTMQIGQANETQKRMA